MNYFRENSLFFVSAMFLLILTLGIQHMQRESDETAALPIPTENPISPATNVVPITTSNLGSTPIATTTTQKVTAPVVPVVKPSVRRTREEDDD
jgi:hypothetical protein